MAKSKKAFKKEDWIKVYKAYLLKYGQTVHNLQTLLVYTERDFSEFGHHFDDLVELESTVLSTYFENALKVTNKDKEFDKLDHKDQHLTFLYLLIDSVAEDELFLRVMKREKSKDPSFIMNVQKHLNQQDLSWSKLSSWRPDIMDDLNINPKRSLLFNHALSCMLFFLDDKSKEKQDTDAYIEKTTDLLFKLTDTSTLHSLLDLGKFFYSRKKASFSL